MKTRFYITPRIVILLNILLISISLFIMSVWKVELQFNVPNFNVLFLLFSVILLISFLFEFLVNRIKQFSITDHWIERVGLPAMFIASIGQEIFFRGVLNSVIGIVLSALLFTFWNFFPSTKRISVIIFFFFLGLLQSIIYLYTKNIVYVIYTNFLFHCLTRVLKYKK